MDVLRLLVPMGGVIKPGMKRELLRSGYSYGVRIRG